VGDGGDGVGEQRLVHPVDHRGTDGQPVTQRGEHLRGPRQVEGRRQLGVPVVQQGAERLGGAVGIELPGTRQVGAHLGAFAAQGPGHHGQQPVLVVEHVNEVVVGQLAHDGQGVGRGARHDALHVVDGVLDGPRLIGGVQDQAEQLIDVGVLVGEVPVEGLAALAGDGGDALAVQAVDQDVVGVVQQRDEAGDQRPAGAAQVPIPGIGGVLPLAIALRHLCLPLHRCAP
jgi:hypothetical protein